MRKIVWIALLLGLALSLITGCAGYSTPAASPSAQPPAAKASSQPTTLTLPGDDWGFPSPFGFYPRGPGYLRMSFLFDTLTWKDANNVIPWLADSWQASDDGMEWTFRLHPGVTWQDGKPLTAEDVQFTYDYLQTHAAAFKWFSAVKKVDHVEVKDERTVVIYLKEPIAGFLVDIAGSVPIIPKHIWEKVEEPGKFTGADAVVGSGPFTLAEYNKAEGRYIYEANANYFKGKPVIDRIIFIKVNDNALALKSGTIDAASFWGKEVDAVKALEQQGNFQTIEGPSYWVLQIIFNVQKPPLDQVTVRQAIAHAIQREQIVKQVTHGGAIVANLGILSPATEWYNPDLPDYRYDPETAGKMLDQAGLRDINGDGKREEPNGEALRFTILTTQQFAREAELVKADLTRIGLNVEVKATDRGTVDGLLREGKFDMAINGHGGIANPNILQNPAWPSKVYQNTAYTQLFDEQARTMNPQQRREKVFQMEEIIANELPVLTLYHPKIWCVYNPAKLDTWFFTKGGISIGIPLEQNKLVFLPQQQH
ncbi:MAG: peptide ABC transporter substrate-binding protein [Anaerolineae bacterium]|nr:peptide ABC transporter substrate-binding protein [Anaerolineae bacterium]